MGYGASTPTHVLLLLILAAGFWIVWAIPFYVVGSRVGVVHPGEAFIPFVGPYIAILHSIKRSGWLCLLGLLPLVSFVFVLWLVFVVPTEHRRTQWWSLPFLIPGVNLIAYYAYAFTLDPNGRTGLSGGPGSTYHVPPAGDWRP
jgi:hypothetical protein